MKKFIIAAVLLVCSSSLFAQNVDSYGIPQNSLNIQGADALVPTAFSSVAVGLGIAIGAGVAATITGGQATDIDTPKFKGWTPFVSAGYEYHFPDTRWSLGPDLGYWHYGLVSSDGVYQHFNFMTLAAAGKLYYKPAGICKLYGGLNLGVGTLFSTTTNVTPATKSEASESESSSSEPDDSDKPSFIPAIQFNPIGMRLGSEKIAFIAELGVGYKGILQLGVNIGL